jgi:uncharacterized membrane protein
MRDVKPTRLRFLSNALFALTIAVLLLQLEPPHAWTPEALIPLWPTALSYAASYIFLIIVWINYNYLLSYARSATRALIWANFAHLFSISLIPFSTAWIVGTHLAPIPVSFYAAACAFVNATYLLLCMAVDGLQSNEASLQGPRIVPLRSLMTLAFFAFAANLAIEYPTASMVLIFPTLAMYLRPETISRSSIPSTTQ